MANISPEEERPEVYYIPPNYEEAGGVLGGRVQTRNFVELCVICGPVAVLEYNLLHFSMQTNLIIASVTLIPLAALCVFGIGGESLSQIFFAFIRFCRGKRVLHYNFFSDIEEPVSSKFSLDRFLSDISSDGLKKAIQNAHDRASEAKTKQQEENEEVTARAQKPKKKKSLFARKKTEAEETAEEGRKTRRKQEKAIGPQTRKWLSSAKKDQHHESLNRGNKIK